MRPSLPLFLTIGFLAVPLAGRAAASVVLYPSADSYVWSSAPNSNYGGLDNGYVKFATPLSYARLLIKFDLSKIPAGSTIDSATFSISLKSGTTLSSVSLNVYRADRTWGEKEVTWNTMPQISDLLQTKSYTIQTTSQSFDVSTAVKNWWSGKWSNDGLIVRSTESSGSQFTFTYWMREASVQSLRPSIVVNYIPPPPPPPQITVDKIAVFPSANAAIIRFNTNVSATGSAEYGFTTSYGSTLVESDPPWLLHSVALTGLTNNATYHYRIKAEAADATATTTPDNTFTTASSTSGIITGSLVKTEFLPAVFYVDRYGLRHPFPNERVYRSWYNDFSLVQVISADHMQALTLGPSVRYRPGSRLVKFESSNKIHAVSVKNELRWVRTEAVAAALYGADWAKKTETISDSYYELYQFGPEIVVAGDFSPSSASATAPSIESTI